jgi:hypothetical protein
MAKLTDEERLKLRGIADGSAVSITTKVLGDEVYVNANPNPVVDRALARIDELEAVLDDYEFKENTEITRLRQDVADLRAMLVEVRENGDMPIGALIEQECRYVALLARTAPKEVG